MDENIKSIIESYTLNKFQIALISILVTVITFFITNWLKGVFEKKSLQTKLQTEHLFNQRKQIKEVLAKNKVHLLSACEDLNRRLWNFSRNHKHNWLDVRGDYLNEECYYLHSFSYRILNVCAWIKKIQSEMIFLDTTIAEKEDLEFIKFLKVIPQIFCDLTFLEGPDVDGNEAIDHFFRDRFEVLPDSIITDKGTKSFAAYVEGLGDTLHSVQDLFIFLDGMSPNENRKRWDRLYLLNLTLVAFLNNYGYDFQKTDTLKMKEVLLSRKMSIYLNNYFNLMNHYKLGENREIKKLQELAQELNN